MVAATHWPETQNRVVDPELIRSCLRGDEAAWSELVDRYRGLVYSVARRYGLSDSDADDVCQNVSMALFRKLGTIRDPSLLPAWLRTAARRECYRTFRQSRQHDVPDCPAQDLGMPVEARAVQSEENEIVRGALRQLGTQREQLLTALFLDAERPDYRSIAKRIGIKVGSIGPTRARCLTSLHEILIGKGYAEAA